MGQHQGSVVDHGKKTGGGCRRSEQAGCRRAGARPWLDGLYNRSVLNDAAKMPVAAPLFGHISVTIDQVITCSPAHTDAETNTAASHAYRHVSRASLSYVINYVHEAWLQQVLIAASAAGRLGLSRVCIYMYCTWDWTGRLTQQRVIAHTVSTTTDRHHDNRRRACRHVRNAAPYTIII